MSEWFQTREIAPGVWVIAEPSHVNSWLVAGSERAVLLDTGLGIAPIRPVAERLTRLPLSVVNTHSHFDHIGGNHEFDHVAIHEIGAPLIARRVPRAILDGYLYYIEQLLAAAKTYREIDRRFFFLLTQDSDPRPLPAGFDPAAWIIRPTTAARALKDGDTIDLGGRVLRVLHTPGHAPDEIALFEEREGLLFAGDTIGTSPLYAQLPGSDVRAYAASTRRLAEMADQVRLVMVCHFGRVIAETGLLRRIAAAFDDVLAERAQLVEAVDIFDSPIHEARFDGFSIVLRHPAAANYDLTEPVDDASVPASRVSAS